MATHGRTLIGFLLLSAVFRAGAAAGEAGGESMKVLMVGNSFSNSVRTYLPRIARAAGADLLLEHATIGGCELARHVREWEAAAADPDHKPYYTGRDQQAGLQEILAREPWDIITIQQASHDSWRPESYEPYAEQLIGLIRDAVPDAEIVVQQTWAYRVDDGRLGAWGIDPATMHARLAACYRDLAERYGLRVIPAGEAVRLSRERADFAFTPFDRSPEALAAYRWPDLPPQAGDVVGAAWWHKNPDTRRLAIGVDTFHLNRRGDYLQACAWFGFLFPGRAAMGIDFIPDEIADDDAAFLAACARDALASLDPVTGNLAAPAPE